MLNSNPNYVGDLGAEALAEVLKYNNTLEVLDLGSNRISDKGIIALADGIEGKYLTYLFSTT